MNSITLNEGSLHNDGRWDFSVITWSPPTLPSSTTIWWLPKGLKGPFLCIWFYGGHVSPLLHTLPHLFFPATSKPPGQSRGMVVGWRLACIKTKSYILLESEIIDISHTRQIHKINKAIMGIYKIGRFSLDHKTYPCTHLSHNRLLDPGWSKYERS